MPINETRIGLKLLKEFQKGIVDCELPKRVRHGREAAQSYGYKVKELVQLSYPGFTNDATYTIAKNFSVKGLHKGMHLALKSLENYETMGHTQLITQTCRLELAGVVLIMCNIAKLEVNATNGTSETNARENLINAVSDRVLNKLGEGRFFHRDSSVQPGSSGKYSNSITERENIDSHSQHFLNKLTTSRV